MKRNAFVLICAVVCAGSAFAPADSHETTQTRTLRELAAACRAAKDRFRPVTAADVQGARAALLAALTRLDQRLGAAGGEGEAWRRFLRWSSMMHQLRESKTPDLRALDAVYARYASGNEGLALVCFADVRRTLGHYLEVARAMGNPRLRNEYEVQLEGLARHLEAHAQHPTSETAVAISESLDWLQRAGQAPEVIRAVRRHFSHPNLMVWFSADAIGAGLARAVDETGPVRDVILGTQIFGTRRTTGQFAVEPIPQEGCAEFGAVLRGTAVSTTVGRHGPVAVDSISTTALAARKQIRIDADGFSSEPAAAQATTQTQTTAIRALRGGRLVERIAQHRAQQQQGQYERIASLHAQRDVGAQLDRVLGERLAEANRLIEEKWRRPFLDRGVFPQQFRVRTTSDALLVSGTEMAADQLGAPGPPPDLPKGCDLAIRVHESMPSNAAAEALAGMIVHEDSLRRALRKLFGAVPASLETNGDEEPWAVRLARKQPISVTFADNTFRVVLRGQEFFHGGQRHPGMNISAVYVLARGDKGFQVVRQSGIAILPEDFFRRDPQKLSGPEKMGLDLLDRHLRRILPKVVSADAFEPKGPWRGLGKLRTIQMEARDGWLVIAWQRLDKDQPSHLATSLAQ